MAQALMQYFHAADETYTIPARKGKVGQQLAGRVTNHVSWTGGVCVMVGIIQQYKKSSPKNRRQVTSYIGYIEIIKQTQIKKT